MYAAKLGCTREHQCLLLQVISQALNICLYFSPDFKEQVHISCRDNPLPPRKAISKSVLILRILLSTGKAYLVYSGCCQIGEKCFLQLNINLLLLLL